MERRSLLSPRLWLIPAVFTLGGMVGQHPAGAVVLLNENFDSSPVDGAPATIAPHPADFILGTNNPGSDLRIAGSGGEYSDPFGGAGNQSLVLHSFNGGCFAGDPECSPDLNEFPVVTWLDEFGDDPTVYRDGVIQFDIYLSTPEPTPTETWTLLDFRLGWGAAGRINPQTIPPDVVIWNQYQVHNDGETVSTILANNALFQGQGIFFPNENPLEADTPFRVKYTLDGATETFQWELTNLNTSETTQLTYNNANGSATDPDWPWGFGPFPGAIDYLGYNSLNFQQDFGNLTSEAYIDNLVVNSSSQPESGDFDGDGDVDGADFLEWQRGMSPNPRSASDLTLWQGSYGDAALETSATVAPEPTAMVVMLLGVVCLGVRRNRVMS